MMTTMKYRRRGAVNFSVLHLTFILTYGLLLLRRPVLCSDEEEAENKAQEEARDFQQEEMSIYEMKKCQETTTTTVASIISGGKRPKMCPREFDRILCWPETEADQTVNLPCPTWFQKMENAEPKYDFAVRHCTSDGTWYTANRNRSYSDYTNCLNPRTNRLLTAHLPILKTIGKVGCFLSFGSLIFAILLLGVLKRLHCPRNILHINLFASFLLFSFLNLIKEIMFVNSVGFTWDVVIQEDGKIYMNPNISHWECKTLISFSRYAESSTHVMVFCEALYLNTLISVSTFSESNHYKLYVIAGWIVPLFWTVPLTVLLGVASEQQNSCWNTESSMTYIQIVPQVALIFANFFLFINILRILTNKLRETNHLSDSRPNRYKKLAKSTLILLPLFSIYYIAFSVWQPFVRGKLPIEFELSRLYFEIICSSFQGLAISLIYCFFNSEVRMEALKQLERIISQHYPSASLTCLSNLTHNRDRAYSNVSMGRVNSNNVLSSNNVTTSRKESKANHQLATVTAIKRVDTNNNNTFSMASHAELEDEHATTNGADLNNGGLLTAAVAAATDLTASTNTSAAGGGGGDDSIVPNIDKKKKSPVFSFSFRKTRFADAEGAAATATVDTEHRPNIANGTAANKTAFAAADSSNSSPETIKLLENKVRI